MDGDHSLRHWSYYERPAPSFPGHLGLQLMPSMHEKPLLDTRSAGLMGQSNGGPFHHHRDMGASQVMLPFEYVNMRDTWNRNRFINTMPENHNYSMITETSSAAQHHLRMDQPPSLVKEEIGPMVPVEEVGAEMEKSVTGPSKKRQQGPKAPKSPKPKKAKKAPRVPKAESGVGTAPSGPRARTVKKAAEVMINGISMDISTLPIPVCSCTGTPQQCYRWGSGGWQSACCTTGLSLYPLPMSTKRRGARIAGRKMSLGAFKKVLEKHAAEGHNFATNPIDLRTHWAKHGTNKFVTIR